MCDTNSYRANFRLQLNFHFFTELLGLTLFLSLWKMSGKAKNSTARPLGQAVVYRQWQIWRTSVLWCWVWSLRGVLALLLLLFWALQHPHKNREHMQYSLSSLKTFISTQHVYFSQFDFTCWQYKHIRSNQKTLCASVYLVSNGTQFKGTGIYWPQSSHFCKKIRRQKLQSNMDKFRLILCDTLLLKYSLFWGRPLQFWTLLSFLKQPSKKTWNKYFHVQYAAKMR